DPADGVLAVGGVGGANLTGLEVGVVRRLVEDGLDRRHRIGADVAGVIEVQPATIHHGPAAAPAERRRPGVGADEVQCSGLKGGGAGVGGVAVNRKIAQAGLGDATSATGLADAGGGERAGRAGGAAEVGS